MDYFARLRAAAIARDSLLCVGLDPDPRILGGGIEAALAHCRRVIDAATVHAYHGADSLEEFARHATRGVYVVAHTSNPGRVDLQHRSGDGEPLYLGVAALATRVGRAGNVGVVMGATAPAEAAIVRARFPELPFLMPGIGRQGGDVAAAVRAAFNGDPASCSIAVAGAILFADDPRAEAVAWRDRIRRAIDGAAA